jgi:hypothetical protein
MTRYGAVISGGALALAIAVSAPAAAMSDRDILGQWCGDRDNPTWVNYRFTRDKLHVTALPTRKQKSFNIVRYDFSDPDQVTVQYRGADTKTGGTPGDSVLFSVVFGHFSADNQRMDQEKSEVGDVYHFRRCRG